MTDEMDSDGVTDSPRRGCFEPRYRLCDSFEDLEYGCGLLCDLSPTLSTSTSSFEALDPHDPNLSRLANTLFSKTSEYLYGELTSTLDDYKLLENMNRATITKYSDMKHIAANVSKSMVELNEKYDSLIPLLQQIDQIEDSVIKLEQAAYKLDAYSKRLEAKFKNLEKK